MNPVDKVARSLARVAAKKRYRLRRKEALDGVLPPQLHVVTIAVQTQNMGLRPADLHGQDGRAAMEAIATAAVIAEEAVLDAEWGWVVNRAFRFLKQDELRSGLRKRKRGGGVRQRRRQVRRLRRRAARESCQ